jgi:hypothetical protein
MITGENNARTPGHLVRPFLALAKARMPSNCAGSSRPQRGGKRPVKELDVAMLLGPKRSCPQDRS